MEIKIIELTEDKAKLTFVGENARYAATIHVKDAL